MEGISLELFPVSAYQATPIGSSPTLSDDPTLD